MNYSAQFFKRMIGNNGLVIIRYNIKIVVASCIIFVNLAPGMIPSLELNSGIRVTGCVTLDKYLRGKTLIQLEQMLGFHPGRFSEGVLIGALQRLPLKHEFILQGYNQVATHNFDKRSLSGLHIPTLKEILMHDVWSLHGPNMLVKVIPRMPHKENMHPDSQYPPGWGIPQWVIINPFSIEALVLAVLKEYPASRY